MQEYTPALPGHLHPAITKPHAADEIMFESRLQEYERMFGALGVLPLGTRDLFDAGCANGKFLQICSRRWGATEARSIGSDYRREAWDAWHAANPETQITFVQRRSDEIDFAPQSFDIVHQSMLMSSVIDPFLRRATAAAMWRVLRPGGLLVSYDFWLNPTNAATSGIRLSTLRELFPEGKVVYKRSLTLAPPLCRRLVRLGGPALRMLESLRLLNTHLLIALEKPRQVS